MAAIQMIDMVVTQNASEALNGVFTITFMDHVSSVMPYDATPEKVKIVYAGFKGLYKF